MNEVIPILLFLGALVGSMLLAVYLCLLPPQVFLRGERWLTEREFREAVPGKAWCRHVPAIALIAGFLLHVAFFLLVRATCTNRAALMFGFLPLGFLWIYVPVGIVELMARVSVLVPAGRGLGGARFIAAPGAARAGAFRLCATALAFAGFLTAAYWHV